MRYAGFVFRICVLGLLVANVPALAYGQADKYPHKPIRIVVPYPAGGGGDIIANIVGEKLTAAWGQRVLIENRPGASGMIGTAYIAREAIPDGYMILLATDIQFAINPVLYKTITYDPVKNFEPIALGAVTYFGLEVNPSLHVNTLSELIDLAKSKPGQLNFGSAGIGSTHEMGMELIKQLAGINIVHVPYKGGSPALLDLVAGRTQMMYVGVAHSRQLVKSGKLKLLAVGSPEPLEAAPGIPTITGTFPGFDVNARWDFYAPAGTPPDIVQKLSTEIIKILKTPDITQKLSAIGIGVSAGGPAELVARNKKDRSMWQKVINKAGIERQ